ncbi:TMEM165/GDT1 family protein [Halobaculum gomorrense]|uniref:Putative Ca2+/H+ antiporter, TMEM165/GDT1 family n=1 Tax=Halobaculum gomorrense TaxID=43928 RepID=A0A1M5K9Y3_9EURY|nr:TMEM165/GDT1 family protein [Halobaculum gomorrense]SHG48993.1 Putative Ca2+/H+ antiporter, TMEM165/GDT1 family [Halobaculum gomorrense]
MSFWEIVVVAAIAQLAVLPGEKVQFIIAGLSTRYRPAVVVAAAGTAFAGWTALEIWFGAALQSVLSGAMLDAFTAAMFLVFAVLLLRSAPDGGEGLPSAEPDGGQVMPGIDGSVTLFGREITGRLGSFLSIFAMMAAGEFGDKTQLVTISLAAQYGAAPAIWVGEMAVIIPVSLANAFFFHRFSHRFDVRKAHLAGAALFAFFGLDTVLALLTGFSVWETVIGTVSAAVLALV